jgi:hypothetical protein
MTIKNRSCGASLMVAAVALIGVVGRARAADA